MRGKNKEKSCYKYLQCCFLKYFPDRVRKYFLPGHCWNNEIRGSDLSALFIRVQQISKKMSLLRIIVFWTSPNTNQCLIWVKDPQIHSRFLSKSWSKRQKTVFLGSFGSIAQNLDIRSRFYYPNLKEELISHKFVLKTFALGAKVCPRRDLEGLKIFQHQKWFFGHNFKTTPCTLTIWHSKRRYFYQPSFLLMS